MHLATVKTRTRATERASYIGRSWDRQFPKQQVHFSDRWQLARG